MFTKKMKEVFYYARAFVVWVVMSAAVGAVCGVVGGAFAITVEEATHLRQHTPWLPWLMPIAGLVIAGLYWLLKLPLSIGTDEIIRTVRTQEGVSLKMAPAIFISTALTHLTGGSVRYLQTHKAPYRFVYPGHVYRNETTDARHERAFFQYEALLVDKNVTFTAGKAMIKSILSKVFGRDVPVRMRLGFFPFVEPGFELDINCLICGGDGCPTCKNSGWLELCPCGMIHPNVLIAGGLDPEKYTGFAFGLGLTRLAMMKYGIKDIRMFNSGSLKSLSQFENE